MIPFTCEHCGTRFKVKDEYAGRTSRCPTCKQSIRVPVANTAAPIAKGHVAGLGSTLVQAQVPAGVTLDYGGPERAGQASIRDILSQQGQVTSRYIIEKEIARGGMGAVLRAIDTDLRREVALKYMLDNSSAAKKSRFVEEAQITGQLEHPNIVPIHELGLDAEQRLFFSMKMVRGRSLAEVLQDKTVTLGKLLTIFVNVCHALSYAHSRGVVHRDLKPANVMIGDFGEVYVMDWGLAKIIKPANALIPEPTTKNRERGNAPPTESVPANRVSSSREREADLTQDGAVLGTPVYMPPEQASGRIQDIDERSDIYGLGAILYEILTLNPPYSKEGGSIAVLTRVLTEKMMPPEQCARQHGIKRAIPAELSAVAMKALAREKKDRYSDVAALRGDIERYQEGRSVSAKEDSFREVIWKLIKRNRGVSAATFLSLAVIVLILTLSFRAIYGAKVQAETNYTAYKQEQESKEQERQDKARRMREAVPAFLRAAELALHERRFEDALTQTDAALDYHPDGNAALLLRAKLLLVKQRLPEATAVLEDYLQRVPDDANAANLLGVIKRLLPESTDGAVVLAEWFSQHLEHALADGMMQSMGKNATEAREKLLAIYRKRLEEAWPAQNYRFQDVPGKGFHFAGFPELEDLSPLQGIPLSSLELRQCGQIRDLTPLKGMPLKDLNLSHQNQLKDLSALKGMPLQTLRIGLCPQLEDLSPLKGLPLSVFHLGTCGQVHDLSPLQGMKLQTLSISRCNRVTDLSALEGMELKKIVFNPQRITRGIEILRRMESLETIGVDNPRLRNLTAEEFWKRYDAGEFR